MSVTLAEILAREVPIHWYENIAVAQQVCARLRGASVGTDLPELQHIELLPVGDVIVTGARSTRETPVARVGFLMHAMLGEDVPVQLRLFISKATLPVPLYGSIDEFSKALEYFERPGRAEHITALYHRYVQAPPNVTPKPVVLLTSQEVARQEGPEPVRRPRWPLVAAGAAAVVAVSVLGLLVSRFGMGDQVTSVGQNVSDAVAATSSSVASTIGTVADNLRDRLAVPETVTPSTTPAAPETPPPASETPQPSRPAAAPRRSTAAPAASAT
jgi:hypothetical protein